MATQSQVEKNWGDPSAGSTIYIGIVGVLIFVLTIIYLEALFYSSEEQQRMEKIVDARLRSLEENRNQQQALLDGYHYDHIFNDNAGRVTIPVEEAQRKLLEEWPNPQLGFTPPPPGEEAAQEGAAETPQEGATDESTRDAGATGEGNGG